MKVLTDYRYDDDVNSYHLQHLSTYNHSHMLEGVTAFIHCFWTQTASDFFCEKNYHSFCNFLSNSITTEKTLEINLGSFLYLLAGLIVK